MCAFSLFRYLSIDRSAVELAGGLHWHGQWYNQCDDAEGEGEFLGRTTAGGFIYAAKNNRNHNRVIVRNILDQQCYIKLK